MSQQDIHSGSWAKSIFRVGKWYILASLVVKGINAFTLPVFANAMSPGELGLYSSINTLKNFIPLIATLGIDVAFARFFHEHKQNKDRITLMFSTTFWFVCGFGLLSATVFFSVFNQLYSVYDMVSIALVTFPPILFQLGMLGITFFNQSLESYRTTLFQIISTLLGVSVSIYLVVSQHLGVKGRLMGDALIGFFLLLLVLVYFFNKRILAFRFEYNYIRQALLFSLPLLPVSLAAWVNTQSTQLLLQHYYPGQSVVGLFGLASSIALLMYYAVDAVTQVLSPVVMSGLIHERERSHKKIRELMLSFLVACLLLHLGLVLFSREMVMLFTANAKGYEGAYWFIAPLGVTYLLGIFHRLFNTIIGFHNKNYYTTVAVIAGALCLFLCNFLLLPHWGPRVTPISILAGSIVMTSVEFYYARRLENLHLGLVSYLKFILVYLIVSAVYYLLFDNQEFSIFNLSIKMLVFALTAILFIYMGNYKAQVKSFIRRKLGINIIG